MARCRARSPARRRRRRACVRLGEICERGSRPARWAACRLRCLGCDSARTPGATKSARLPLGYQLPPRLSRIERIWSRSRRPPELRLAWLGEPLSHPPSAASPLSSRPRAIAESRRRRIALRRRLGRRADGRAGTHPPEAPRHLSSPASHCRAASHLPSAYQRARARPSARPLPNRARQVDAARGVGVCESRRFAGLNAVPLPRASAATPPPRAVVCPSPHGPALSRAVATRRRAADERHRSCVLPLCRAPPDLVRRGNWRAFAIC